MKCNRSNHPSPPPKKDPFSKPWPRWQCIMELEWSHGRCGSSCKAFLLAPAFRKNGGYNLTRVCRQGAGVPRSSQQWGYPHPVDRGYPILLTARYPILKRKGIPILPTGSPPPIRTRWGTPTPPRETHQHSEYLLRGRRYASCVQAGLSCLCISLPVVNNNSRNCLFKKKSNK